MEKASKYTKEQGFGKTITVTTLWLDLSACKPVSFVACVSRSTMFGGPRQGAASTKNNGTGPQTHSSKRQPRESNAQGQCRAGNAQPWKYFPAAIWSGWLNMRIFPAAVPEDGSVAFPVQPAHGEAALVRSALSAHCSLSVPSTLQGAVRLRGWPAAGELSLMTASHNMHRQSHAHRERENFN